MRKTSFYPKLAACNLWRNHKTYVPYLLASIVSIFTFYTMLAINTGDTLTGIRQEAIVRSFTAIGTIIVGLFCGILIFYTNSFLIKRRKKEIGLYSVLGMEKRNIAVLMLYETVFMAGIALLLGLGLGMLLSKLIYWILLRMIRLPVVVSMPISPSALLGTVIYFVIIFIIALLFNLMQVRMANPIRLMQNAKSGERQPKASWLVTIIGIACIGGAYFIATYFTSPSEVLMMFLLAVALVIIGTFCLFTSGSIALLKLMRRNKKYYYKPQHFISVSGMIYRMKQNAAGLATICILSCMVLATVASVVSLNIGAEESLRVQMPSEVSINYVSEGNPDAALDVANTLAEQTGVQLKNINQYRAADINELETAQGVFETPIEYDGIQRIDWFSLRLLEDYADNEAKGVTLEEDEALMLVYGGEYAGDTLTINGVELKVKPVERLCVEYSDMRSAARNIVLVLKDIDVMDKITAGLLGDAATSALRPYLSFDLEGADENKAAFISKYRQEMEAIPEAMEGLVRLNLREESKEDWYGTNGAFLFIGVYFGILFMLAAALIIYYKQLSEGYDDAERFEILQKVGMSEAEVKKTINRQILTVFFLPLVVALLHIGVAFVPLSRIMVVFGIINIPLLLACFAGTALVYAIVYFIVFRQTARTYFSIVRR